MKYYLVAVAVGRTFLTRWFGESSGAMVIHIFRMKAQELLRVSKRYDNSDIGVYEDGYTLA